MSEIEHVAFFGSRYSPLTVARWEKRAGGLTRWHIVKGPSRARRMKLMEQGLAPPLPVTYCGRELPGVENPGMTLASRPRPPQWRTDEKREEACALCLEQWTEEENRRVTKAIFSAWGGFEPARPSSFITTPNI